MSQTGAPGDAEPPLLIKVDAAAWMSALQYQ